MGVRDSGDVYAGVRRTDRGSTNAIEERAPLGVDVQPFSAGRCAELLSEKWEWTSDVRSFLARTLAGSAGLRYADIRLAAEEGYFEAHPEECTFPLISFQDFMRHAYRFGLLAERYESPNGDPRCADRVVFHSISPAARPLIFSAEYLRSTGVGRAEEPVMESLPPSPEVLSVLDLISGKEALMWEDVVESLTRNVHESDLDEACARVNEAIRWAVQQGLISVKEDDLGSRFVALTAASASGVECVSGSAGRAKFSAR